jgi:apolipoprotein N-acyltransferase
MPALRRLALIAAAAGLLWLCLHSEPCRWLPFFALAPFALALRGVRPLSGLLWGWLGGAGFWAVSTWWAYNSFILMLDWPWPGALGATILFCLFQGIPYALLGLACGFMNRRGRPPGPLFCASLLALLVYLRPVLCPGSPALTLYSWPQAIQAADLGGFQLINFLMLLINWILAEGLANLGRPRRVVVSFVALGLLLAALLGYGSWRLDGLRQMSEAANKDDFIVIRSIQPNIPIKGLEDMDTSGRYVGAVGVMLKTTQKAAAELPPADLVLWPEVPTRVACDCEDFRHYRLHRADPASGGPVLVACVENDYGDNPVVHHETGSEDGRGVSVYTRKIDSIYNSLWLVDGDDCRMAYRKVKLVPFGERTPLQETWPWLRASVGRTLEYTPGPGPAVVELPSGKKVQPLICFESGFAELAQVGVAQKGARALVNVSDDAWFVEAKAAKLHLALALFRAVEQRRPLVRCTNSGFGAHIRATGEIVPGSLTGMYKRTFRQARMYCPEMKTIYARLGDAWLWLLAAVAVFALLAAVFAPR